jgi:hypothetical protein
MTGIFDAIFENSKLQLSKNVDKLIIDLKLSTFSNIDNEFSNIDKEFSNIDKKIEELKSIPTMYEMDIQKLKDSNIGDTFSTTSLEASKQQGFKDGTCSIRVGLHRYKDWNGFPEDPNVESNGNICLGNQTCGSEVALELFKDMKIAKNVAIGNKTLANNRRGNFNVGVGHNGQFSNEEGIANTAVGYGALFDNVKGNYNTAIGSGSGNNNSGSYCTFVGRFAGRGPPNLIQKWEWTTCLGSGTVATNSHQVILGTEKEHVYVGFPTHIMTSDESFHKNRVVSKVGLDFINRLEPIEFELATNSNEKEPRINLGLSAQSVKKVMDELDIDYALYQNHEITGGLKRETLSYTGFIPPIIKAIQELDNKIQDMKEVIANLKKNTTDPNMALITPSP